MSVLLALAATAAPAPIEPATPRELYLWQDAARCVVARAPKRVVAVLDGDFREREAQRERLQALLTSERSCLVDNIMRARGVIVPGFLAEAAVRASKPSDPVAAVAYRADRPVVEARDEGEAIALCTVRAKPAEVWALFQTVPGKVDEDAVLKTLIPTVGSCTAEGAQASFNKPGLRAILALAYRRLMRVNEGVAMASGGGA